MNILIEQLLKASQLRHFKKGSTVYFQGEIPRKAFIVREGVIRAYTVKTTGEESTVSLFTKDDIIPLPWLLSTTANTLFYYEAVTDVRVMSIAKEQLHEIIKKDTSLMSEMLSYSNKQYTSMLLRITGLNQSRAVEKISYTFYYLLFRYGVPVSNDEGMYDINLKLNHAMIASLTGLTRESTTVNLQLLKKKGIIIYERSAFTVHKRKLENFIGEDGFRELSL